MDRIPARRLAFAAALILAAPAYAQDHSGSSTDEQLREIKTQLDAVRADNARLRGEVEELRLQSTDHWLTEQRADEVRALVNDVLADADTRASLLNDGMTAGWSDGFFMTSPDGRFKLELSGQIQTRWLLNYSDKQPDSTRTGWEVPRTRLTFRGHVFSRDIEYLVRYNVTSNESGLVDGIIHLQDAWVRVNLNDETSIRFGEFKVPFMREELVDSSMQLAVERSLVNERMSLERTQGVELMWAWENDQIKVAFIDAGTDQLSWQENFFKQFILAQTAPASTQLAWSVVDAEFAMAARWEHRFAGDWAQFADFTSPPDDEVGVLFGLAGFFQVDERDGTPTFGAKDEYEWFAATADLSIELGGANLFFSATYHYGDTRPRTAKALGVVAQGGLYLTPKIEAFARFDYGYWDVNAGTLPPVNVSDLYFATVGVNYYIDGHDLKWTTDLGVGISRVESAWFSDITGTRADGIDQEPQIVFRTQFQLLF